MFKKTTLPIFLAFGVILISSGVLYGFVNFILNVDESQGTSFLRSVSNIFFSDHSYVKKLNKPKVEAISMQRPAWLISLYELKELLLYV
jgi:hypothetical protein